MEKKIQLRVLSKLLVVVVFAGLYAWGGMEHKWLRRFVAPFILCMSMWGYTRDWKALLQMPFMMFGLSFGYGANTLWTKILRRLIYGLANGSFSSLYNGIRNKWLLVWTQVGFVTVMGIILGVWNPFMSARAEETVIGLTIALIPMMSAEKKA